METTPTNLRADLYRHLDRVAEGEVLYLTRGGTEIEIRAKPRTRKLDRLKMHPDLLVGDLINDPPVLWNEAAWLGEKDRQLGWTPPA